MQSVPRMSILGVIDEVAKQRTVEEFVPTATAREERFDRITRLAQQLFGVKYAHIVLLGGRSRPSEAEDPDRTKNAETYDAFYSATLESPDVLTVFNATKDRRFASDALSSIEPRMRFFAGMRLEAPGGEVLGAFIVSDENSRVFTEAEKTLLRDLAIWVQNEMMAAAELGRAAEVQRGLLPHKLLSLHGFQVAGGCLPARAVGGDFYDWYPVGEGAAFTLADVMGKGIGAAIIAATVRAVLRSGSRRGSISSAVEAAAAMLESDLDHAGTFVTLFHARLDMDTGRVRYIDAGHGLSLVVFANGSVKRLATTSLPLGSGMETHWREHRVTLSPGDTLVSVSDGVLDLYDGTLSALTEVEELVRRSTSAQQIVDSLLELAGSIAPDDVTVVVVRRDA